MPSTVETVRKELSEFCKRHDIKPSDSIALAFSGGSDSLALLLALHWYCEAGSLSVFYVNHHLRSPQVLAKEIELNRKNCAALGLDLIVLDLGEHAVIDCSKERRRGIEESARFLRYEALSKACKSYACSFLATAHNADDQLETLLMRLFQSSSIDALSCISQYQQCSDGPALIRPLLGLRHTQLRDSVVEQGFDWAHDASNEEDVYLRNRVRHTIKPALLQVFPQAYQATMVMSRRFGALGSMLQDLVDKALDQVIITPSSISFKLAWFKTLEPVVQEALLYRLYGFLFPDDGERIRGSMIEQIHSDLLASSISERWTTETSQSRMTLSFGGTVCWEVIAPMWQFCLPLHEPMREQTLSLPNDVNFCIEMQDSKKDSSLLRLDAGALVNPVVRSVLEKDEIVLAAGTVLVTKLLSQYKIPRHLHPSIPLLCDAGGVVAVFARFLGGRDRLASRFKVPLAHRLTNIYSSNKRNDYSEI